MKDLNELNATIKDKTYFNDIKAILQKLNKEEKAVKGEMHKSIKSLEITYEISFSFENIDKLIKNINKTIEEQEDEVQIKEKILLKVNEEIASNPDNSGEVLILEEQCEEISMTLDKLHSKEKSICFITSTLDEAINNREEKQLNKLVNKSLETLNFLTGNQFITKINEETVKKIITNQETSFENNPMITHLLMLSIKIALTNFLNDIELTLPLIIDDQFLFMDDERGERLKDLVMNISDKRQVILFTHQSDKKDWGNYLEI